LCVKQWGKKASSRKGKELVERVVDEKIKTVRKPGFYDKTK